MIERNSNILRRITICFIATYLDEYHKGCLITDVRFKTQFS